MSAVARLKKRLSDVSEAGTFCISDRSLIAINPVIVSRGDQVRHIDADAQHMCYIQNSITASSFFFEFCARAR